MSDPTTVDVDRLAEVWAAHLTCLDTDAERLTCRARELEQRGESRAALELRREAATARVIAEYLRAHSPDQETSHV